MLPLHEIDAWRAALVLVQHYGPHAAQRAHLHLDTLRQAGDAVGVSVWGMIARAVDELIRDRREDEPLN